MINLELVKFVGWITGFEGLLSVNNKENGGEGLEGVEMDLPGVGFE